MKNDGSKQYNVWVWSASTVPGRLFDYLEVMHNGMGRWLWDVGNVRNELIRGEA